MMPCDNFSRVGGMNVIKNNCGILIWEVVNCFVERERAESTIATFLVQFTKESHWCVLRENPEE